MLGGNSSKTNNYKYDTLTDTYMQLTNIPYDFTEGSTVAIGTNIYLFGSAVSSSRKYAYKYNTITNQYVKLDDMPYEFYDGNALVLNSNIYLFGDNINLYPNYTYKYNIPNFQNKEILVQNKELFKTKLTKQLQTYFNNAFIYDDDELKLYPCYYGDGTKWNLIEKAS